VPRGVARTAAEAFAVVTAADYQPLEPYPGPHRQWRVRCTRCGAARTLEPRIVVSGRCPCHGCVVARAEQDLADAGLVTFGLVPSARYPACTSRWAVRCRTCSWQGTVVLDKLRQGRRNCRGACAPAPSEHRVRPAEEAATALQARRFDPLVTYPGCDRPWPARHLACGQRVEPTLNNLQCRPDTTGCLHCGGAARLDEERVDAFLQSLGAVRAGSYVNARQPLALRCSRCGLSERRRYDDIAATGIACSHCAGKKMHASTAATLAARRDLEPLEPLPGSTTPCRCRCRGCGHTVTPRAHDLRRAGACSTCANSGFDPTALALVYLLHHTGYAAYNFGITNTDVPTQRIAHFRRKRLEAVVHLAVPNRSGRSGRGEPRQARVARASPVAALPVPGAAGRRLDGDRRRVVLLGVGAHRPHQHCNTRRPARRPAAPAPAAAVGGFVPAERSLNIRPTDADRAPVTP
jgi:hypothetical protein